MHLTQAIKAEAHQQGFDLVGVTTPAPPPHAAAFEEWLAAGRHADMAYLNSERSRERRANPQAVLPGCQSILILGKTYRAGGGRQTPEDPASPRGRIAAYAWEDDYHLTIPPRLQAIVAFIETQTGQPIAHRIYTDTGPVLERDLAQRAGLGWIGKNTCLIHPRLGSFFLLAEIFLDIALLPDEPFSADRCGACTRCIDACPTACILPNRTLDAGRCIAYLTIEKKGAIPNELRSQTGPWVFGCDICQQVCPWNRHSLPASAPESASPALSQALALTPGEFNQTFRRSPILRAKRRGYLRNLAVAAANCSDRASIPALIHGLLHDAEPLIRGHCAWALGALGGDEALAALQFAARREPEASVQAEIRAALQWSASPVNP